MTCSSAALMLVSTLCLPALCAGGEGLGFAIPIRYVIDFLKNRDAFAYNSESSAAGYRYLQPPARQKSAPPALLQHRNAPEPKP